MPYPNWVLLIFSGFSSHSSPAKILSRPLLMPYNRSLKYLPKWLCSMHNSLSLVFHAFIQIAPVKQNFSENWNTLLEILVFLKFLHHSYTYCTFFLFIIFLFPLYWRFSREDIFVYFDNCSIYSVWNSAWEYWCSSVFIQKQIKNKKNFISVNLGIL